MTATKIQPGDDTHLTLLMAPHSLNFVTGADRAALLAYGRDVFAAARDSKCLAQIEEPAGAAPAAVAPQGEYPHEQMDAMALARYKVVPSHASMLWSHAVVAGDGVQQLYVGREAECQNMARKFAGAFLDGAFAFHSMAAAPTTQAAPALEAPAAPSRTSVAVLQCDCCGHIGINDAADGKAACNTCRWTGDSPAEDKCPGCNRVGTMTTACPECGARTTLIAETHLQAPAALEAPAAPESAPWCPDVCPITGRPFFMWIDHWQTGKPVPTYGGPYDSYTIPVKDSDGSFECERYDHDEGGWLTEGAGWHCLGVRLVDDQSFVVDPSNPRYHEIEAFAAAAPQAQASAPDWWRGRADEIEVQVAATGNSEAMRCYTDMRTLLQAAAPALEAPAAPPVPVDEFRGDTPSLVRNIVALLELDADGALVPHGVGGHARGLLSAAAARLAAAPQAPAAPVLVGDGQADAYLADPGRLETLARSHPAGLVRALARAAMAAPAAPAEGEVLVEVIGLTGSGKSAICGEIEILCRALGLDVSWPDGDPEKNMTHAEWTAAIEAYKPRVRIVERNVPRQSNGGPAK